MRLALTNAARFRRSLSAMARANRFRAAMLSRPSPSRPSWFAAAAPVALALLAVAALLAVCRVLGGVHFPRDVIAGALVGVAVGGLAAFLATLL